jgi:hypothetical protein
MHSSTITLSLPPLLHLLRRPRRSSQSTLRIRSIITCVIRSSSSSSTRHSDYPFLNENDPLTVDHLDHHNTKATPTMLRHRNDHRSSAANRLSLPRPSQQVRQRRIQRVFVTTSIAVLAAAVILSFDDKMCNHRLMSVVGGAPAITAAWLPSTTVRRPTKSRRLVVVVPRLAVSSEESGGSVGKFRIENTIVNDPDDDDDENAVVVTWLTDSDNDAAMAAAKDTAARSDAPSSASSQPWGSRLPPRVRDRIVAAGQARAVANKKKRESDTDRKRRT